MSHVGSCKCGAIQFQIDQEPVWTGYCHCGDCRKATGAPVSAFVIFKKEDVQWSGDARREHKPSSEVTRSFCGTCGSPISYEHTQWPDRIDLSTGLFDDVAALVPTEHIWCANKLPWLNIQDELPRKSEGD